MYAPQANLSEFEKDRFYQMLQCTVVKVPASEQLFVCGDWNGHIGSQSTGFEEVHGGQAIGKRNTEGERVLEFAFANELVVGNTWFKKKPKHLVTIQSGKAATQIDFILYRRSFRKQVSNVKVILGEEIALQHRLLVGDFGVSIPPQPKCKFVPRIKVWKLRDPEKQAELSEVFKAKTQDSELSQTSSVDVRWTSLKDKLLQATKQVCGVSSNNPWRKQMRRDNQDVMGEKPVKNDAGQLSLDEESKKLEKSIMSIFLTLSSLGTQRTCQRKAQLRAQASQSPWR